MGKLNGPCLAGYVFLVLFGDAALRGLPLAQASERCMPDWAREEPYAGGKMCKYGKKMMFDVTWNDEVSEERPVEHFFAVCWSYVPVVTIVLTIGQFFLMRGTRELQFLLFLCWVMLVNEAVVKPIVGQKRPEGSCNFSCGMPSGHSTCSVGFLALLLLDAAWRVCPAPADGPLRRPHTVLPFVTSFSISNGQFACFSAVWCLLLAPVPISRVILKDHSVDQVVSGAIEGTVFAIVWFYTARWLSQKYPPEYPPATIQPGRLSFHLLRHDYIVPTSYDLIEEACHQRARRDIPCHPVVPNDGPTKYSGYGM